MGNSAGAAHSTTWLLEPSLAESRASISGHGALKLAGVALVSMPAHFQIADASRSEVLKAYYGDRMEEDCAFGVLNRAEDPHVKTLVATGTLDPEDEICQPCQDFVDRWKSRFGSDNLSVAVLDGHNHFSTVFALGTGIEREESLGKLVLEWIGQ